MKRGQIVVGTTFSGGVVTGRYLQRNGLKHDVVTVDGKIHHIHEKVLVTPTPDDIEELHRQEDADYAQYGRIYDDLFNDISLSEIDYSFTINNN